MNLTIIGDVHGKVDKYKQIVDQCDWSICVGDFGFETEWNWHVDTFPKCNHYIVGGNHDYGPYLPIKKRPCPSLGNFHADAYLFTVRGAKSIDRIHRTEGVDWFENEELTYTEGLLAYDAYVDCRPNIVVSHECPQSVKWHIFGYPDKTDTNQLLQAMFEAHQPKLWVFGHYHHSVDVTINGTRFVCLNELETLTIDTDEYKTI